MRNYLPWFSPSKPEQIQVKPWLSPNATAYLEGLLKPDFEVLEHGSGGSTLWFAERVQHVIAVEINQAWRKAVQQRLSNGHTVILSLSELPSNGKVYQADLLLIDGEPVKDRAKWLQAAPALVKPGGYVVLDNANRPEYQIEREEFRKYARHLYTENSNTGGCEFLITEFYQL